MPSQKLHVKPRKGLTVRDPDTGAKLPAKGGRVANTPYWRRRIAVGDVETVQPGGSKKAQKKEG